MDYHYQSETQCPDVADFDITKVSNPVVGPIEIHSQPIYASNPIISPALVSHVFCQLTCDILVQILSTQFPDGTEVHNLLRTHAATEIQECNS